MILIDTGPLVALIDRSDPNHQRVATILRTLSADSFVTTLPCFTEAMYFLGKEKGYFAQQFLWKMRRSGKLILHTLSEEELDRMEVLMQKYSDLPMDIADASLVVIAETLRLKRIFTLDDHFRAYRVHDSEALFVFP